MVLSVLMAIFMNSIEFQMFTQTHKTRIETRGTKHLKPFPHEWYSVLSIVALDYKHIYSSFKHFFFSSSLSSLLLLLIPSIKTLTEKLKKYKIEIKMKHKQNYYLDSF